VSNYFALKNHLAAVFAVQAHKYYNLCCVRGLVYLSDISTVL